MKTRELQTLWWDWLGTSERLLRSLHEQTAAVTLRDVARVERIQPELDALIERMRLIDEQAVACANRLADETEVPVHLVATPLECVVLGAGLCLDSFDSLRPIFAAAET